MWWNNFTGITTLMFNPFLDLVPPIWIDNEKKMKWSNWNSNAFEQTNKHTHTNQLIHLNLFPYKYIYICAHAPCYWIDLYCCGSYIESFMQRVLVCLSVCMYTSLSYNGNTEENPAHRKTRNRSHSVVRIIHCFSVA